MVRGVGLGPLRETRLSGPAKGLRGVSRTFTHCDDVLQPPAPIIQLRNSESAAAVRSRFMADGETTGDARSAVRMINSRKDRGWEENGRRVWRQTESDVRRRMGRVVEGAGERQL
jgi:hypothetical protein